MKRIYLDYAATTPPDPEVVRAMLPFFNDVFGNPSATCSYGQEAKDAIEDARGKVAGLIGAQSEEIIFTSGGTEADNFAITGIAYANEHKGNHIITSSIEHHAVLEVCALLQTRGFRVTYLPVDKYGWLDPQDVKKAITDKTILVSVMHANNEIGTVEPIAEIGTIVKEAGICFHTDAVQTVGHLPVDVGELGVDLLALSGHKLYGPKGIGALYIKNGTNLDSFIFGGEQEKGKRAGTENVPGIVGLGRAAELAQKEMSDEIRRIVSLRDTLIAGILKAVDHTQLNGHPSQRLPNNANMHIDFIEGESMTLNLDLEGICASTGSACDSKSLEPSHVLLAVGMPREKAYNSLRLTLGKWTTKEEIDRVLDTLPKIVKKLRVHLF